VLLWRTLIEPRRYAIVGALLLAVSYGYWHYSTEPESYAVAVAPLLLAALAVHRPGVALVTRDVVAAGSWHALAVGLHQLHALFALVLVGLILSAPLPERERRRRLALVYLAVVATLVGALYLAAAAYDGVGWSPVALARWATHYAHTGAWGSFDPANAAYGAGGAFTAVMGKGLAQRLLSGASWSPADALALAPVAAAGGLLLGLMIVWLRNLRRLDRASPFLTRFVALCALAYVPFLLWWEPYNLEFWIVLLPPLWTAVSQVAAAAPLPGLPAWASRPAAATLLLLIAGYNLVFEIAPESDASRNEYHAFTSVVAEVATSDDLIVSPIPQVEVYGAYFFGKRFRRLALHHRPSGRSDFASNRDSVHAEIDDALARGRRVFIAEHEMRPPPANVKQLSRFALEEYAECYGPYRSRLRPVGDYTWLGVSYQLYEIVPAEFPPGR
jgi:hypothetical protein